MKGIELLKREIHKELESWHGVEGGIDGDGINEIMLLINQLEESEVKQLDRKIEELESYNDELIRDNNQFRNELDNQEVLSEEWIERNTSPVDDEGRLYVWKRDLQNAIVPKPELPVIPEFVADWYESEGERNSWWNWFYKWGWDESRTELEKKTIRWMQDYNEELFVDMFRYGYEVEVEQKYYVMNNDQRMMLVRMMDGKTITEADPFKLEDMYEVEKKSHRLTEQEIKDYDPRYFAFAVKVEELESPGIDQALNDLKNGNVNTFESVEDLMNELEEEE